jgi:predicted nucleic acid-binding protein
VTVVSDTSPISYLVLIGREEVIPELYGDVLVPKAVYHELVHPRGPEAVRRQISGSPTWMNVEEPNSEDEGLGLTEEEQGGLQDLDPREREAILLAVREEDSLLLIDERAGRAVARKRGLAVTGTIGVLGAAAQKGLIDPAQAVRDLREATFRASVDLYRWLLDKGK